MSNHCYPVKGLEEHARIIQYCTDKSVLSFPTHGDWNSIIGAIFRGKNDLPSTDNEYVIICGAVEELLLKNSHENTLIFLS